MNKYQMVFNAIITIAVLYTMWYVVRIEDQVSYWLETFEKIFSF